MKKCQFLPEGSLCDSLKARFYPPQLVGQALTPDYAAGQVWTIAHGLFYPHKMPCFWPKIAQNDSFFYYGYL